LHDFIMSDIRQAAGKTLDEHCVWQPSGQAPEDRIARAAYHDTGPDLEESDPALDAVKERAVIGPSRCYWSKRRVRFPGSASGLTMNAMPAAT
jgi:hypothetical protein